ncbi:MAG: hypothetical protein V2B18_25400 [Pseudomonadota bacterium]
MERFLLGFLNMTMDSLQDVLGFIDDDTRFLRWVAEIEQPGPWGHNTIGPVYYGDECEKKECCKCGQILYLDSANNCPVPDPLTKGLAEIVEERIKGALDIYLIEGALRIMVEIERARECTNFGDAIIMAYEWFIRAGAKRQYVVVCFAEGKVK